MHHGCVVHCGAGESVSSDFGIDHLHDQCQFVAAVCTVRFRVGRYVVDCVRGVFVDDRVGWVRVDGQRNDENGGPVLHGRGVDCVERGAVCDFCGERCSVEKEQWHEGGRVWALLEQWVVFIPGFDGEEGGGGGAD